MQKRDKTNYGSANNKRRQTTIGLLKVFLTFVALIGIVGFSIRAFGAEEQSVPNKQSSVQDYPWYGYDSYSKGYPDYSPLKTYHNLKVNLEGSKDYQTYCFNLTKHFPSKLDSVKSQWYKKLEGNDQTFRNYASQIRNEQNISQKILDVLYNGYPNNANGLMNELEPLNAIIVTQNAIWYYSDSAQINPDESFKTEAQSNGINDQQLGLMRKALKELIDPNLGSKYSNKTPSGYRLNVFESHDKTFQNLLSAEYVPDTPPKPGEEPPAKTEKTSVIIRKYAEGDYSKLLEGATLKLSQIEGSGFQEQSFESSDSGRELKLPDGTYILTETKSPQGYAIAEPITFKVTAGKVLIKKGKQFIDNPYKEVTKPYSFEAYNDFSEYEILTTQNYAKFYYAKNQNGSKQVVYCFNADLHSPPDSYDYGDNIEPDIATGRIVKYTQVKGVDLLKYTVNARTSNSSQFLTWIKKVIFKGYKGEGDNIPSGLTPTQFRAATQLAIYYFTNSADLETLKTYDNNKGYHGFEDMNEATLKVTKDLVAYALNNESANDLPDLDFLIPNNNSYQSLVGTQYHPESLVDIIRMEDKQAPIIPITHKLTISKTVTGTIADKKKEFNFEIHLKSSDGQAISGTYPTNSGELTVTDGKATFTLKDGESLIVEGLPSGYSYEITETGASDYEVSVNGKNAPDGKATKASVKEDETVTFENRKDLVPPTGLTTDGAIYLWLLLLVPLGLLVWLFGRKGLKND
ncbi:pilus ancillary protein 1 [Streptococcus pyogenes]|uniref:pilus ancillary protein 1 n=1 Tax=Streptococcus pyogenes TaxID=1314 RepID=UPI00109D50E8|nr:pilus ancillary protein 1 [Streptococcus pyogenes]VGV12480.1 collagen binding protein [Streptococcus pyogenes]VGV40235.1 collagen binding protein [Streptococcus pyogenes]VGW31293.1 collagen binding protein [Streptococcus pyogenes]VHB11776.1 collagen binding protein [Streptococcus pyogenes]VHC07911.1 collagen binding protein [Streptococcus pyogenes]